MSRTILSATDIPCSEQTARMPFFSVCPTRTVCLCFLSSCCSTGLCEIPFSSKSLEKAPRAAPCALWQRQRGFLRPWCTPSESRCPAVLQGVPPLTQQVRSRWGNSRWSKWLFMSVFCSSPEAEAGGFPSLCPTPPVTGDQPELSPGRSHRGLRSRSQK